MKKIVKISALFALCFSLYGCPEEEKTTETNTVDLAMNETEAPSEEIQKQENE